MRSPHNNAFFGYKHM